jgi:putative phosphoribosyl transferase
MKPFADRRQAGRQLAAAVRSALIGGPGGSAPVVAGLPRGGVPVAAEVATALDAPLDVLLVRKVGVPFQPELAMGAVGEGDLRVVDQRLIASLGITAEQLAGAIGPERLYLDWVGRRLRESRPPVPLAGRTVVVVDDGFATGATAAVACRAARAKGAAHVLAAAPVGSHEAVQRLLHEADQVVVLHQPRRFVAVGRWYVDFSQISEQEVVELLLAAGHPADRPAPAGAPTGAKDGAADGAPGQARIHRRAMEQTAGDVVLELRLADPADPVGLVVLVSGSDTARHGPEQRTLADLLNRDGWSTVLVDPVVPADRRGYRADDVPRLAARLADVLAAVHGRHRQLYLLGTGIGAAACLALAARPERGRPEPDGVVSWGGRPDLLGPEPVTLRTPVLLVVSDRDEALLRVGREAAARLGPAAELVVVPGDDDSADPHLRAAVVDRAVHWFRTHPARCDA